MTSDLREVGLEKEGAMPVEDATEQTSEDAANADEGAKLMAAMKEAGIENPAQALETIRKLRPYEKGEKLPSAVARELEGLRAKVKEAEDAKLSDTQKAQARSAELEAQNADLTIKLKESVVRSQVASEAVKAGALDPGEMWRFVEAGSVEYTDKDEPANLEKLVGDLKTAKPYLFGTVRSGGSFDGGARGTVAPGKNMNDLMREALGH